MAAARDAQLLTVRHFSSLHEALIARELLASEGIEAFIPDEYSIGANPGVINAFGGVRLQVRSEDVRRATEMLEAD
jgi:hypothetical protein